MRSTTASFGTIVFVALIGACAEAGGEIKGGEITDAGVAATTPPEFNPGSLIGPAPCFGTGTRWSDLYNDIFGPTERGGSCSLASNCHGSPDSAGVKAGGILCADVKGCRQSFFDKSLVSSMLIATPEKAGLLLGLLRFRKADGTVVGFMPQAPADYMFSNACIERIQTWIRNGAQDD